MTGSSPLHPTSPDGRPKRMAEVLHKWRERGTERRLVIVRPGVVFGPGERGNFTYLARALSRGAFFTQAEGKPLRAAATWTSCSPH